MLIKILFGDREADHKNQPKQLKIKKKQATNIKNRAKQTQALSKEITVHLHIFPVTINPKGGKLY